MKINIKYISSIILFLAALLVASCNSKQEEGDGHNHGSHEESHGDEDGHDHSESENKHSEHGEGESIHLTADQIKTIGLELGSFSTLKVNDYIKSTGSIGLPPNGYSSVSVKAEGIIEGTKKYVEGDYIEKGEVIGYVASTNFIVIQQEYLEAKAELKLKELDLERQQSLVNANAGVSKSLQNSQAEVEILKARTSALAKQLEYLGISVDKLTHNSLSETIPIVAPMSGFISAINLHNGMYAVPSNVFMEIMSSDFLHLELDIFEKDIASVKIGQKLSYTVPALGDTIYSGEVSVIGKEFDIATKTVRVYGNLDGQKPTFLKDLFINAKIWLNDAKTNAVPEGAIIKDGNDTFIYAAKEEEKETEFTKIRVIASATNNGFTAVKLLEKIPEGMQIVTKGAYYVNAQSKAGELEHEH
ncbi:MAG: efflux RND transporter periplasmic adaptor subunit [Flavobacteriales bacterium]|jgi:cobalt-zinc-cadmium efflux system membrane fusion protein|nr:efflux RND transporter periplasmic adaptor subunit [Flavobacteriales bacterium]